jgi:predicted metalloprotease
MEWDNFRRSDNIEDRRADGSDGDIGGGGGFGGATGGLGIGAIIVLGLISWALGIDPRVLIGGAEMANNARHSTQYSQNMPPQRQTQRTSGTPSDQMGQFVAAVLAQTEDVWTDILPAQKGIQYIKPRLVLFSGQTRSGCGMAQSATGPFYCPADKKVYLDLSFFGDMKRKLGGGGDFAYAYVIAHEIGHHIQDQLGILAKANAREESASKAQANAISVRIELMADCLAGVWAANADEKYHVLQPGDVEKAINTAKAIGDDRLEQAAGQRVVLDSFTHGSSAQRVQWLNIGLHSGQVDSCNTFAR